MASVTDPMAFFGKKLAELQLDVSQLSGSCNQISESQRKNGDRLRSVELELAKSRSEFSQRLGTLERQIGAAAQSLARIEASSFTKDPRAPTFASSSASTFQVPASMVAVADDTPVGFGVLNVDLATRESLLGKIELPIFEGRMPYGWICRVERYFRVSQYSEDQKLELVSQSLEGRALNWYEGEMLDLPFTAWAQFKERMLARFAVSLDDVPVFNGSLPYGWVCRMERFFRAGQFTEEDKLRLVPQSLTGAGLDWYKEELTNGEFTNWSDFKQRVLTRFSLVKSDSPSTKLLKQEPISHSIQEADLSCEKASFTTLEKDFITTLKKTDPIDGHESLTPDCVYSQVILTKETSLGVINETDLMLQKVESPVVEANVSLSTYWTVLSKHEYAYQQAQLRMRMKQQKRSESWRFRFKNRVTPSALSLIKCSPEIRFNQSAITRALQPGSDYVPCKQMATRSRIFKYKKRHMKQKVHKMSPQSWQFTSVSEKVGMLRHSYMSKLFCLLRMWWEQSLDLHRFIFGDEMLKVKHRWRYKPLHCVSDLALDVDSVVFITCSALALHLTRKGVSFTAVFARFFLVRLEHLHSVNGSLGHFFILFVAVNEGLILYFGTARHYGHRFSFLSLAQLHQHLGRTHLLFLDSCALEYRLHLHGCVCLIITSTWILTMEFFPECHQFSALELEDKLNLNGGGNDKMQEWPLLWKCCRFWHFKYKAHQTVYWLLTTKLLSCYKWQKRLAFVRNGEMFLHYLRDPFGASTGSLRHIWLHLVRNSARFKSSTGENVVKSLESKVRMAVQLFNKATEKLEGTIGYQHAYVEFSNLPATVPEAGGGSETVSTCPAAMGFGFAAGTTDGPGVFDFQEGDKKGNTFWKLVRNMLITPDPEQVECQKPIPILLDFGHKGQTGGRTLPQTLMLHHSWILQEPKQKQRKCVKTWMFKYKLGDKLILKGGSIDKLAT